MASLKFCKVSALPSVFEPHTVYLVSSVDNKFSIFISDETGTIIRDIQGGGGSGGTGSDVTTSISIPDPATTVENFWWNPRLTKLHIKTTVDSVVTWTELIDYKPVEPQLLQSILYYYGNPSWYMGILSASAIADEIASNYTHWVVGAGLQDPSHPNYSTTVQILQAVKDRGLKIYGNILVDTVSTNYSVSQISTMADQWKTIGADGIFLDKFGFDGGSTRQRQIDVVTSIRAKSLLIVASSYESEEFMLDTLAQTGWASGDSRYIRWQTQNPLDQASPVLPGDVYVMPEFCYNSIGPLNFALTQKRAQTASAICKSEQVSFWTQTTLGESAPGTVNPATLGNLNTLTDAGDYITATAYVFDVAAAGSAGASYGSNGTPISAPLRKLPSGAKKPSSLATVTNAMGVAGRYFGTTYIFISNNGSQSVTLTGQMKSIAEKDIIGSEPDQAPTNNMLGSAAYTNSTAYATAAQGALAATAVQPGSLATVATTGAYSDLTGKPALAAVATSGSYLDLSNRPIFGTAAFTDSSAYATAEQGAFASTAVQPGSLATVATTGSYSDLSGRPTLAAVATSGAYNDLTGRPVLATVAATGAYSDLTGRPILAAVATSGSYTDLSNRPVLGTAAASDSSAYATAAQGVLADTAVQPGSLATVATTGSYNDILNKPSIPAAQVQTDWNASSGMASILNKPAVIAAGATYVEARTSLQLSQFAGQTSAPALVLNNTPSTTTVSGKEQGVIPVWDVGGGSWVYTTATNARFAIGAIDDAPSDSNSYIRKNGEWTQIPAFGNVTLDGVQKLTNKEINGNENTLTVDGTDKVGYLIIPKNSVSAAYTLVISDAGKSIMKTVSGDITLSIPSNTSVPFKEGTAINIVNYSASGDITISTTDTLVFSPEGTTGSRTLGVNGIATIIKVTSTVWMITGSGLI